jgi:homoserine O-acetyltransferase/O-succinyltransferase
MEVALWRDRAWFSSRRKFTVRRLIALIVVALAVTVDRAGAQSDQSTSSASDQNAALNQRQSDVTYTDYKFRAGMSLPQLHIHYTTFGTPHKNVAGEVDNAILFLHWTNSSSQALSVPEFKNALFAVGAPFDATRYFVIVPDDIGHGKSSKPSDGLKASFPHYGYGDMVDLQHKVVVETLGIQHLHAVVGMSMGCMNAWQWAELYPSVMDGIMPIACFPAPISGRNLLWRRLLIDNIRSDPGWENGNYRTQPLSAAEGGLLARMMIDGVPALQQEVRTVDAADAIVHGAKGQTAGGDANDLLYAFESSTDFNAEPGLNQITTKVFALNFADDEFYRDSLQILQKDMEQVHQGKIVVRPVTAGSAGHLSMSHPNLWKDQVAAFMKWLDSN